MKIPFVSVIIPFFDVEDYLDECLPSIYCVTSHSVQVVLIDDGSTDRSSKISEKFNALHPDKTILIKKEYGGVSAARNVGLRHATGIWIAFLDSDDFIDPKAFDNILRHASKSTNDVIAYDGYRIVEETKNILPLYSKPNLFAHKGATLSNDYLCALIDSENTNIVTIWDKIYKKSVLDTLEIKFIDHIVHEDVAFTFSVLLSSVQIEFLPEKVVYYRQRSGSIMYTNSPMKLESKIFLVDYLLELFESRKLENTVLNGYVVFTAKGAILQGGKIKKTTLDRLRNTTLSLKKRLTLYALYFINMKNGLKADCL